MVFTGAARPAYIRIVKGVGRSTCGSTAPEILGTQAHQLPWKPDRTLNSLVICFCHVQLCLSFKAVDNWLTDSIKVNLWKKFQLHQKVVVTAGSS